MKLKNLEKKSLKDFLDENKKKENDFSDWLAEHINSLSKSFVFEIIDPKREEKDKNKSVSVDIIAKDEKGDKIIIENQLKNSDYGHLGQIITYISIFQAKKAIWIVEKADERHIRAVTWLNEVSNDCDFYLVEIELCQIDNSEYAPLFKVIVNSGDDTKDIRKRKKEESEKERLQEEFWTIFLEKCKSYNILESTSSRKSPYVDGNGKKGVTYRCWINDKITWIELAILYVKKDGLEKKEANLQAFKKIEEQKKKIEKKFGGELVWNEYIAGQGCYITKTLDGGGLKDKKNWDKTAENAAKEMKNLIDATQDIIEKL